MVLNIIESKVAKGWVFFDENWTVDVKWLKEYTIKFAFLYLKKCEREKQKTENDCQVYKMRVKQDWLVNSFVPNSFKGGIIVINFFAIVFPLRLCNCVKKFVSLS